MEQGSGSPENLYFCSKQFSDISNAEGVSSSFNKTEAATIAMSGGEQGVAAQEAELVLEEGKEGSKEGCNCCGGKEAAFWVDDG